jgi:hypothetical protein
MIRRESLSEKSSGVKPRLLLGLYGSTKQLAEKVWTGRESNTSGAKALIVAFCTARLKPCPDTKHEFFRKL